MNVRSSSVSKSFDLRAFSSVGQVEAFRTSSSEPHLSIDPPTSEENQLSFTFPSRSVTTLRISATTSSLTANLVVNGDFESDATSPWFLLYGDRQDSGINGQYVRRGRKSGYIDYTDSELSLMQNVTVAQTKTYYLSAWCSTSGPNTLFGILVNGEQGPELTVKSWSGYQLYGLSVDAKASDILSIYIYSRKGNHNAQIDDVELH